MQANIDRILKPDVIAIIGASRDPAKRGARAIQMLKDNGYSGKIVPINPKESEISGLTCYPSLERVPFDIDLALVCTPARTAPEVIAQCGQKKVPGAVMLAGGFSEASEEGARLEQETVSVARRHGVRIIGPNTAGTFDAHTGCVLMGINGIIKGDIGVLSQSGNVLVGLVAQSYHLRSAGFSTFIGLGNEADIRYHEYIDFYAKDPNTKALIVYLEGLKDGGAFIESARRMTREKPIIAYKAGRTSAGQSAARSHSGSLAGDYAVAIGAMKQAGIIVVERSDEVFATAELLSRDAGKAARRVAILSEGGGPIAQAVDSLSENGLELPVLDDATEAALKAITPAATQLNNPVDCGGGTDPHPRYYHPCAEAILSDDNIDALMVVGYFGGFQLRWEQLAEAENAAAHRLVELREQTGKAILVQCHYGDFESEAIRILRAGGISVIRSIEVCARALGALADYAEYLKLPAFDPETGTSESPPREATECLAAVRAKGRTVLPEPDALRLLSAHGITTLPVALIQREEDVDGLPQDLLRRPVALKIVSPDVLHKTEFGGVMLNLKGSQEIARGHEQLVSRVLGRAPEARIDGVMVVPMVEEMTEIILGMTKDSNFGPTLMFGMGGTSVEVYGDVAFCGLPLSRADAHRLIDSVRGKAILEGARGAQPVDKEALADLILKFADVALAHPEIEEMDLNPVRVRGTRYDIIDARILLHEANEASTA